MAITAKVRCASWIVQGEHAVVRFSPDYADGANADWAYFTPVINISMNVRSEVAFEVGTCYTLTFEAAS